MIRKKTSSRSGGPATIAGIDYQVRLAALRVTDEIHRFYGNPTTAPEVTMEARDDQASGTNWDFRVKYFSHQGISNAKLWEAKSSATSSDVLEFVGRTAQLDDADSTVSVFGYSEGPVRLLRELRFLCSIAREATNEEQFASLVSEVSAEKKQLIDKAGKTPWATFHKIRVKNHPADTLSDNLLRQCKGASSRAAQLRDHLIVKLSEMAKHRQTMTISSLLTDLSSNGLELTPPAQDVGAGLSTIHRDILVALQACHDPLPAAVFEKLTEGTFAEECSYLTANNLIAVNGSSVQLGYFPAPIQHDNRSEFLAKLLTALIAWMNEVGRRAETRSQVRNCLSLGELCVKSDPELVSTIFVAIEKTAKDVGNKHLTLDLAELCLRAAHSIPGTRPLNVAHMEAQTLICGRSWVYQRIDNLQEAAISAQDSLKLGQDLQWGRNTAYCEKCLGRLRRLQAEKSNADERQALFQESVALLQKAAERFSGLSEFGPIHPEVGDCFSLLARTYLMAGQPTETLEAIGKAKEILQPRDGKDYFDLLIVIGDYESRYGNKETALEHYRTAIEGLDVEFSDSSEVLARALLGRAHLQETGGKIDLALNDLEKVKEIYSQLDEQNNWAKISWQIAVLRKEVSQSWQTPLHDEFLVKLNVLEIYNRRPSQGCKEK